MFLQGLRTTQLEKMLDKLETQLSRKNSRSSGYFDLKRQIAEIEKELKIRDQREF